MFYFLIFFPINEFLLFLEWNSYTHGWLFQLLTLLCVLVDYTISYFYISDIVCEMFKIRMKLTDTLKS